MQQSSRAGIRLPKELLAQLDVNISAPKYGRAYERPPTRKAQRRAARVQKKTKTARVWPKPHLHDKSPHEPSQEHALVAREPVKHQETPVTIKRAHSDKIAPRSTGATLHSHTANGSPTAAAESNEIEARSKDQRQLDRDDAEIAALEKKLGIKGKQELPQAFADDGLSGLLDGLNGDGPDDTNTSPERQFDQEWLRKKRERQYESTPAYDEDSSSSFSGFDDSGSEATQTDDVHDDERLDSRLDFERQPSFKEANDQSLVSTPSSNISEKNGKVPQDDADVLQLQKLARRCVNRLSEANFVATVAEAERLYQDQPRRTASEALLEATFSHLGGRDSLSDSFLILYAGFLAAMFKSIGPEFGVEAVRRISEATEQNLNQDAQVHTSANLLTTLAQLFNFRVISSELVYDFVRVFVTKISERNTQLLLRIMKACGTQLRQEDPSSLKDIITHLQSAVAKVPQEDLSVRTKYMIEMITDLKNNKLKASNYSAGIAQEQIHRMKKLLASMGRSHVHATEPLRISLSDFHDDTKTGQWWSAGAKHRAPAHSAEVAQRNVRQNKTDDAQDIQTLASTQRMNTDIRRSIFVSLMSASDGKDAYSRILGLNLKKSQDLDIPKVLIHCLVAEQHYNPYYTFVADQLCTERRMRISFQISLWNTLREAEDEEGADDDPRSLTLRSVVHLAKMFGELVAHQRLDLKGLKNLEFATISARMHAFLEIFLLTVLLQTRGRREHRRKAIREIFLPLCDTSEVARAVRFFLRSTVRESDIIANDSERERVRHGCEVVDEILQG